MKGPVRQTGVSRYEAHAGRTSPTSVLALLERHGIGFPRIGSGESGYMDVAELTPAAIDQLLSQHSEQALLDELDALEKHAEQWKAALVSLRAAISGHRRRNGDRRGPSRPWKQRTTRISAPPCEADDEYWYL